MTMNIYAASDLKWPAQRKYPYRVPDPYIDRTWEIGEKRVDQALNDFHGEDDDGCRYYATGAAKHFGALRAVKVQRSGRSWWVVREQGFKSRHIAQRTAERWAREAGAITHFIDEDDELAQLIALKCR